MPGSQSESPAGRRKFGTDTLRPVTIKQLIEAHHPQPDAEHFMIDDGETTQVTFVGQIRNISEQATNKTYKVDDGTGIIEVKVWKDMEQSGEEASNGKPQPTEQGYARVWGRLKAFNNKRHVGAQVIRPVTDYNEIQYHLLEATAVHLHFTRGPLESLQSKGGANGATNGEYGGAEHGAQDGRVMPAGMSGSAKKVYQCLQNTPTGLEGMHMQQIAMQIPMEVAEVQKAGQELQDLGMIYTTLDDYTWAVLDV
jgi:replication factor A2